MRPPRDQVETDRFELYVLHRAGDLLGDTASAITDWLRVHTDCVEAKE